MLEFNPPPGWPPVPRGWVPPHGWSPDPRWPPAPQGWQFYVARPAGHPGGPTRTHVRVAVAVVLALVVALGVVAVRSLLGHPSVDVVENGFSYRIRVSEVRRPAEANGLIAKPGFAFVQVVVEVENLQSDRGAPAIDGVIALAAAPEHTTVTGIAIDGVTRYCAVRGTGPGAVSTGIAGAPPGWCFFSVAADREAATSGGALAAGETVEQTYDSTVAFPSDLDASAFHVYGRTGAGQGIRARDVDLGAAG